MGTWVSSNGEKFINAMKEGSKVLEAPSTGEAATEDLDKICLNGSYVLKYPHYSPKFVNKPQLKEIILHQHQGSSQVLSWTIAGPLTSGRPGEKEPLHSQMHYQDIPALLLLRCQGMDLHSLSPASRRPILSGEWGALGRTVQCLLGDGLLPGQILMCQQPS